MLGISLRVAVTSPDISQMGNVDSYLLQARAEPGNIGSTYSKAPIGILQYLRHGTVPAMEDGKPESAPGAGSEKTHNVFIESDQRPDILIEKYKLHKQEAMHHQLLQSRETNYIQLFGLFLFFDGHTYIWRKAADRSFEGSWLH